MPSMTIYISPMGTPLEGGGTSLTGHMYYTLTDADGTSYSYGFAPVNHGQAFGPGEVYTNDTTTYTSYSNKWEFPLSQSQFDNVHSWSEVSRQTGSYGDYSGTFNNCVTFTFEAMAQASGLPQPMEGHNLNLPSWTKTDVDYIYNTYMRQPQFNKEFKKHSETLSDKVHDFFMSALQWLRPKDPLVLDLDGDGIEATAINPNAPILFDQNADGIKTATGWINSDDGIVVMDVNGNGTIDSGRELFGDNTLLPDGSLAANGFAAIGQYDLDANGKIDS